MRSGGDEVRRAEEHTKRNAPNEITHKAQKGHRSKENAGHNPRSQLLGGERKAKLALGWRGSPLGAGGRLLFSKSKEVREGEYTTTYSPYV